MPLTPLVFRQRRDRDMQSNQGTSSSNSSGSSGLVDHTPPTPYQQLSWTDEQYIRHQHELRRRFEQAQQRRQVQQTRRQQQHHLQYQHQSMPNSYQSVFVDQRYSNNYSFANAASMNNVVNEQHMQGIEAGITPQQEQMQQVPSVMVLNPPRSAQGTLNTSVPVPTSQQNQVQSVSTPDLGPPIIIPGVEVPGSADRGRPTHERAQKYLQDLRPYFQQKINAGRMTTSEATAMWKTQRNRIYVTLDNATRRLHCNHLSRYLYSMKKSIPEGGFIPKEDHDDMMRLEMEQSLRATDSYRQELRRIFHITEADIEEIQRQGNTRLRVASEAAQAGIMQGTPAMGSAATTQMRSAYQEQSSPGLVQPQPIRTTHSSLLQSNPNGVGPTSHPNMVDLSRVSDTIAESESGNGALAPHATPGDRPTPDIEPVNQYIGIAEQDANIPLDEDTRAAIDTFYVNAQAAEMNEQANFEDFDWDYGAEIIENSFT